MSAKSKPKITLNPNDAAIVLLDKGENEQPKIELYLPVDGDSPQCEFMAAFMCWAIGERDLRERFQKHVKEQESDKKESKKKVIKTYEN
tara:strand:- start:1436 stop:1702 length:267 start_codon:yes stop_codon:yes gene_type:complete